LKGKVDQRWLWHAIDHETGEVLAYVIGQHQDSVLLKLKELLKPLSPCSSFGQDLGQHLPGRGTFADVKRGDNFFTFRGVGGCCGADNGYPWPSTNICVVAPLPLK
jgi:hypothetical protein